MTEDRLPKAAEESSPTNGPGKQRKKRKWDQPADSLMSAGMAVTGTMPWAVDGVYASVLPGVLPLSVPLHLNPTTISATSQSLQMPLIPPNAAAIVQKLNQPKILDELIAREIVINDADPSIRYKLTKRQTQEEIQKSTGAVVITRGKYRPPNGLPDGEKPLYLHISAGAHLKDTVERIKAVDHAALMVEDMLKQCQSSLPAYSVLPSVFSNGLPQATQPLNTCLYLGFEPDPSLNIAVRIRGPNDQYINHIMNETGATVVLRGHGSENPDNSNNEKPQQPLHLFLSSSNPKSLEDARILAENLLDTICAECGISRISSSKTYNAVPPPQQLLAGLSSANSGSTCIPVVSMPTASLKPTGSSVSSDCSLIIARSTPSQVNYCHPSMNGGTSYSGYGGIYPQATPLQQVALALRQAPTNTSSPATTSQATVSPKTNASSAVEMDKRPSQKRKFQELPVSSVRPMMPIQNLQQESEFLKPGLDDSSSGGLFSLPPLKKLLPSGSSDMPPPPARTMPPLPPPPPRARTMPPPPPPPKFSPAKDGNGSSAIKRPHSEPISITNSKNTENRNIEHVPDTLLKLMEYGDEDDTDGVGE